MNGCASDPASPGGKVSGRWMSGAAEVGKGHGAFIDTIKKSGELITTQALADPSQSAVVRVRGGQLAVTDGPYLEAKEHLGGFYLIDCESNLIDCESKERASEHARRARRPPRPCRNQSP